MDRPPFSPIEDKRLVLGKGRYANDMVLPGMLHLATVPAPHAHAVIKRIDTRIGVIGPTGEVGDRAVGGLARYSAVERATPTVGRGRPGLQRDHIIDILGYNGDDGF